MNRLRLHQPLLEALEDRFLPSVSPLLPPEMQHGLAQSFDKDVAGREDHHEQLSVVPGRSEPGQVTDELFIINGAMLSHLQPARPTPMLMVIVKEPMVQLREVVWYAYLPVSISVKPAVKTKSAVPSADVGDVDDVVHAAVSQSLASNSLSARPATAISPKDLVAVERAMEAAGTSNSTTAAAVAKLTVVANQNNSVVLSSTSASQSVLLRAETPAAEPQSDVTAQPLTANDKGAELTTTASRSALTMRTTENQGLNTDESSLIFSEMEQAFQTLIEPFAASLQSFEPSMLWVFLSTWLAAAGITYEYLRRKAQLNAFHLDAWIEWRTLPRHTES